jgi:hypothetical protein
VNPRDDFKLGRKTGKSAAKQMLRARDKDEGARVLIQAYLDAHADTCPFNQGFIDGINSQVDLTQAL